MHERILLAPVGDGRWISLNPDLDLETVRLAVTEPGGIDRICVVPDGDGRP